MRIKPLISWRLSPVIPSGAVAALIGLVVIIGWQARVESVLRLSPSYPAMAFRTALGVAFSGLALLLLAAGRPVLALIVAPMVAGTSLLAIAGDLAPGDRYQENAGNHRRLIFII